MGRLRGIIVIAFLVLFGNANAQESNKLALKFKTYYSGITQFKLHVEFVQNVYMAGDTAYFNAFLLDEHNQPIGGKVIINSIITDSKGVEIDHIRFNVFDGTGYNQWVIPPNSKNGIYQMASFPDWTGDKENVRITQTYLVLEDDFELITAPKKPLVAFEGGSLVNGVLNNVAVKFYHHPNNVMIKGSSGVKIPMDVAGSIGIGALIPNKGVTYFIQYDADSIKLPSVKDDGIVPNLVIKDDKAECYLAIPENSSFKDKDIMIVISTMDSLLYEKRVSLSREIPTKEILTGLIKGKIHHLSIFDQQYSLVAQRAFYFPKEQSSSITISGLDEKVGSREDLKIEIEVNDFYNKPLESTLQVKVINKSVFNHLENPSLAQELNYNPIFFAVNSNRIEEEIVLNNHLLFYAEWHPWNKILSGAKPIFNLSGTIKKVGKARMQNSKRKIPENAKIMFYLQKSKWSKIMDLPKNGELNPWFPDVYQDDELFYQAKDESGKDLNILIDWQNEIEPNLTLTKMQVNNSNSASGYSKFKSKVRLIDDSYHFYVNQDSIPPYTEISQKNKHSRFIRLSDYKQFSTIEKLVKEVIPYMKVRKRKKRKTVIVKLDITREIKNEPLYIIDGIVVKKSSYFLGLDPRNIKSIEVLRKQKELRPYGLMGSDGVVIVNSKKGKINIQPLTNYGSLKGINKPLRINDSRPTELEPDFKSILYFNPLIKTKNGLAEISFSATDDTGLMHLEVKGVTSTGDFIQSVKQFSINLIN